MDKNKIKDVIRNDIINNLECIVDSIIDYMELTGESNLPSHKDIAEVIKLIREGEDEEDERKRLDYFLGKNEPPAPVIRSDGSVEPYTEIDVDGICDKIKIANEVFRFLYKFKIHKKDSFDTLPSEIKEIMGAYELSLLYEKNNNIVKRDASRKWLMGIALVGIIRYKKLANSPYMLDDEIKRNMKNFFKGIENIYNFLSGDKIMIDPKDKGYEMWNTENNQEIKFRKKVLRK